jgi:vacuolar-type H+-ATPase subunit I/STV1
MMLTKFFAKFLGLWALLVASAMISNRDATASAINALFADPALVFVTGVFTLAIGLAIVILHNRWSGGALAVVVTLYGWIASIKGMLFLCLPSPLQAALYQSLHFQEYFYGYFVVSLVLGAYLTYGGFTSSAVGD